MNSIEATMTCENYVGGSLRGDHQERASDGICAAAIPLRADVNDGVIEWLVYGETKTEEGMTPEGRCPACGCEFEAEAAVEAITEAWRGGGDR